MAGIVPFKRRRHAMLDVYRGLDDWFKRAFQDFAMFDLKPDFETELAPPIDISENTKEITVKAEMPGLDTKDLDITLEHGFLKIKGEKTEEKKEEDKYYHRVERRYGSFCRTIRLPAEVKSEKIDATYKNGILTVVLPKVVEAKPEITHVKVH
jgi:HSP20 family protein